MTVKPLPKDLQKEFEETALPHVDAVYSYLLTMTQNPVDAEDVTQETFLKAYKNFHKFTPGTNIKAWLFKIAKNTFINKYRKDKKQPLFVNITNFEENDKEKEIELPSEETPEDRIISEEIDKEIEKAFSRIPQIYRAVVTLADIEGFSYKEIADILDIPIGTVMSRLYRGRKMLENALVEFSKKKGIGKYNNVPIPPTKKK